MDNFRSNNVKKENKYEINQSIHTLLIQNANNYTDSKTSNKDIEENNTVVHVGNSVWCMQHHLHLGNFWLE